MRCALQFLHHARADDAHAERAQVETGISVLEIGAGTGYNAILLSHIIGPSGRVVSVEANAEYAEEARRRVEPHAPSMARVVTADGALGVPDTAPYDRLIATVGCGAVPDAWWDQLADDGEILVPLRRGATFPLVRMRKTATRGGWTGTYLAHANFMTAIGNGIGERTPLRSIRPEGDERWEPEQLDCPPDRLEDLAFFVALDEPESGIVRIPRTGGQHTVQGIGLSDTHGSAVVLVGGRLHGAGRNRALGEQMLAAVECWQMLGRPKVGRFRLTIAPAEAVAEPDAGAERVWRRVRAGRSEAVWLPVDAEGTS